MYRIGIIGSDNSHAIAFSKLVNLPDEKTGQFLFPDFKVTAIYGHESKRTEEVAAAGEISKIVSKPEDMIGQVDAVMVVFRHGDLHLQYALPFVEKGIPVWVDKPFTIQNEEAKVLIESAKKHHTLITGGSTTKYISDVLMIKNAVDTGESRIGDIKTALINFPAELDSVFGGIHFYGHHLVEMTLAAFGYKPKSVFASENNGCVAAIVRYDKYQVTLNFVPKNNEYYAILFGEKGTIIREIDIAGSYRNGFEKFAEMLKTKQMPETFEQLYAPVELQNAIVESYTKGLPVNLQGL